MHVAIIPTRRAVSSLDRRAATGRNASSRCSTRRGRRRSSSSTARICSASTATSTTGTRRSSSFTTRTRQPRPTRRAPTSSSGRSRRTRIGCWYRPGTPSRWSSGRSASPTAKSPRSRSRWNQPPRNQQPQSDVWETVTMAIEVRIPTILRSHTNGEKSVEGKGETLGELFYDLDNSYGGLRSRLVSVDGSLNRFVNVYLNDEDVRFLGGIETPVAEGDVVTILPAVAGGAAEVTVAGGAAVMTTAGGAAEVTTAG